MIVIQMQATTWTWISFRNQPPAARKIPTTDPDRCAGTAARAMRVLRSSQHYCSKCLQSLTVASTLRQCQGVGASPGTAAAWCAAPVIVPLQSATCTPRDRMLKLSAALLTLLFRQSYDNCHRNIVAISATTVAVMTLLTSTPLRQSRTRRPRTAGARQPALAPGAGTVNSART